MPPQTRALRLLGPDLAFSFPSEGEPQGASCASGPPCLPSEAKLDGIGRPRKPADLSASAEAWVSKGAGQGRKSLTGGPHVSR